MRKIIGTVLMIMVLGITGCGKNQEVEMVEEEVLGIENHEEESIVEVEVEESIEEEEFVDIPEEKVINETLLEWLPTGVVGIVSEREKLPELEQAIATYYDIPEEDLDGTRYYYNYVDLDNNGVEEIFAVVIGT